jgi:hypothetical protein
MTKSLEVIFLILLFVVYANSKTLNKKTKWFGDCYRYGITQQGIENSIRNNRSWINASNQSQNSIAYFATHEKCEENCSKNPEYHRCIKSGYDYDKAYGIPENVYVCWLKSKCDNTDKILFTNRDPNIHYEGEEGCDYACRGVYGNSGGKCILESGNGICYWRNLNTAQN